nr:phospholipase-like protein [Tanacetum cinerariifolium]
MNGSQYTGVRLSNFKHRVFKLQKGLIVTLLHYLNLMNFSVIKSGSVFHFLDSSEICGLYPRENQADRAVDEGESFVQENVQMEGENVSDVSQSMHSFASLLNAERTPNKVNFRFLVNENRVENHDTMLPFAAMEKILSIYDNTLVGADYNLKHEVSMAVPMEGGIGYTKEVIRFEYEWKPSHCADCKDFGHSSVLYPKRVTASGANEAASNVNMVENTEDGFTHPDDVEEAAIAGMKSNLTRVNSGIFYNFGLNVTKQKEKGTVTGLKFGVEYSDDYDDKDKPILFRRRMFSSRLDGILQLVLLGLKDRRVVPNWILRLANDRDSWDDYPWGSYVWPTLYYQLRDANVKRWLPLYATESTNEDDKKLYSLLGFIWAFKTWCYDSASISLSLPRSDLKQKSKKKMR